MVSQQIAEALAPHIADMPLELLGVKYNNGVIEMAVRHAGGAFEAFVTCDPERVEDSDYVEAVVQTAVRRLQKDIKRYGVED